MKNLLLVICLLITASTNSFAASDSFYQKTIDSIYSPREQRNYIANALSKEAKRLSVEVVNSSVRFDIAKSSLNVTGRELEPRDLVVSGQVQIRRLDNSLQTCPAAVEELRVIEYAAFGTFLRTINQLRIRCP